MSTTIIKSLVVVFIGVNVACAPHDASESTAKIVNGQIVSSKDDNPAHHSAVGITIKGRNDNKPICTGTLVAEQKILTAAHCVREYQPAEVSIFFAKSGGLFGKDATRSVTQIQTVRDNYSRKLQISTNLDLAVLTFSDSAPKGYQPIPILPPEKQEEALKNGQEMVIAGFGVTSTDAKETDGKRRFTTTKLKARFDETFARGLLLLEGNNTNACLGDSGGPAYVKSNGQWYVVGATQGMDVRFISKPQKCESSEILYTNATAYHRWLRDVAGLDISSQDGGFDPLAFGEEKTYASFKEMCEDSRSSFDNWVTLTSLSLEASSRSCDAIEAYMRGRSATSVSLANIMGLSFLRFFPELEIVSIRDSVLRDLSPLANVPKLNALNISSSEVTDTTPIGSLANLQRINISGSSMNSVASFGNLKNVREANLYGNKLTDISGLAGMTALETLHLTNNNITTLPVFQSPVLSYLELRLNKDLSDLSPLYSVKSLKEVFVYDTKLRRADCAKLEAQIPDLNCVAPE